MGPKRYIFAATQAACIGKRFQFTPKIHTHKKGLVLAPTIPYLNLIL